MSQQQEEDKKITENAILYGLTHPKADRWKQILANTFLDSWTNLFHQVTNFTKSLIKTL